MVRTSRCFSVQTATWCSIDNFCSSSSLRSKLVEDARYDSAIARAKRHRWLRSFTRSISFNTTRRAIENKKEERMSVKKMSRFLLFLKIEIGRKSFNLFYW